ncbi:MAG: GNAT family N-acetyltransferase [Pseudomonadota bacterium]
MTRKVSIVLLSPAVLPLLAHIADDVFDQPVDQDLAAAWASAPHHIGALAVQDGIVIGQIRGYLQVTPDGPPQAMVDNLGVSPAFQRRGIATQLWAAFTAEATRAGATTIYVLSEPDNEAATQFYASLRLRRSEAVIFEASL